MNQHLKYEIHWQLADNDEVFQIVLVSVEAAMRVYGEKLPLFACGYLATLSVRKLVQCEDYNGGVHKLDWIVDARLLFKKEKA